MSRRAKLRTEGRVAARLAAADTTLYQSMETYKEAADERS